MCCTERERAASASHCPERLRGFFVYTGGSVLLAGAHSPSSKRTAPEPFFPHICRRGGSLPAQPARILLRAHRVRPFIALHAFVRSAGHRRANPLLVPQTNLSEQVRSGRDGKGPRSFLQLIRSVRSRLNEGGGARLKFGLFVFLLKKRRKKRKDAKPGCRDCSNPAAPTRFVYRRRASGYRSAASASCRSLSLCVRGRDFVSGEKLSVCDGGREVCVRAYLSGIQRSRKKKNVARPVFGLCSCG